MMDFRVRGEKTMRKTKRGWLLFFIMAFMAIPEGLAAKAKHGAGVVITERDGLTVKGELIVVRRDSVLLKESGSSYDVSIPLSAIKTIKVDQGSGAVPGVILGIATGGIIGMYTGQAIGKDDGGWLNFETLFMAIGAAAGVVIGGGSGLWIGSSIRKYETFYLERAAPEGIPLILGKLRSRARFPDEI